MGAIVSINSCLILILNCELGLPLTIRVWLKRLSAELEIPTRFESIEMNDGAKLKSSLVEIRGLDKTGLRTRLLIAGSNLEDAITFECLEALAEGFDVFLPTDLIIVSRPNFATFHWDRLKQAGAVPTTMAQMLDEWSLSSQDITMNSKIKTLAAEFKLFIS